MKNENKCFFSISLENGIIITGNDEGHVREFLHEMHSAFFQLGDHLKVIELNKLASKAYNNMMLIGNAIKTINDNNYE